MKVLFATCRAPDYLSACLWDGLQEVMGEDNVIDAADCPYLHSETRTDHHASRVGATRVGRSYVECADTDFDLMVLSSAFLRDHDWHWAHNLRFLLKPEGKVAFLEGWDSAREVSDPLRDAMPSFHPDAVFRREIDPAFSYPYGNPHHLGFAAPSRWFVDEDSNGESSERPIDVFFAGGTANYPCRDAALKALALVTHSPLRVVFGSGFSEEEYFYAMRSCKLALCPSGAAWSDCMRTYEAAACGAVPVFVGYPLWRREPWFDVTMAVFSDIPNLPAVLDEVLQQDLGPRRRRLVAHAQRYHTTAARARQLLKTLGLA